MPFFLGTAFFAVTSQQKYAFGMANSVRQVSWPGECMNNRLMRQHVEDLTGQNHDRPNPGTTVRNAIQRFASLRGTIDSVGCSELLHCTPEQVEELARAGEIPGLKIGRGWIFVRADLLAYLAEKAREEAGQRRAKRLPASPIPYAAPVKRRRQEPPQLPALTRV